MWRSLLAPRRLLLVAIGLVVAGGCVRLGIWQLDRLDQRRTLNAAVERGLARPPRSLVELIPLGSGADVEALAYRRAEATGTYDPDHEVVLYGRAHGGRPGNHVLTPLVMDDGRAVIVDRGWVPIEEDRPPVAAAAPPAGPVTVTGILFLPESAQGSTEGDRDGEPPTTLARIDLELLGGGIPQPLVPMYLQLQRQRPAQAGTLPEPAPLPRLDEGPHLSYAFQWFAFATIALIGTGVLLRRDLRQASATPSES